MDQLKYFFDYYFYQTKNFDDLDDVIRDFKLTEDPEYQLKFICELHRIIELKNYDLASNFIKKYGNRTFDVKKTEKFLNFLYDKLIDRPTNVKSQDFKRNITLIFCPHCTPDIEKAIKYSLIEKARVIKNNLQIYICRPCKLVWASRDIKADNAQDYKKFMKTLGLKGTWKELKDIDYL